jgi:hypothetical protein
MYLSSWQDSVTARSYFFILFFFFTERKKVIDVTEHFGVFVFCFFTERNDVDCGQRLTFI